MTHYSQERDLQIWDERLPWWFQGDMLKDEEPTSVDLPQEKSLYPHQVEAIKWLYKRYVSEPYWGAVLADEMGMGKTITAIAFANTIKPDVVVIVCPSHLKGNWEHEWYEWSILPYEVQVVSRGTGIKDHRVYIVSYDSLYKVHIKGNGKNALVILDETHYIKNVNTSRHSYAFEIRETWKEAFFLMLTGTPITNTPEDLYTLIDFSLKPQWNEIRQRALEHTTIEDVEIWEDADIDFKLKFRSVFHSFWHRKFVTPLLEAKKDIIVRLEELLSDYKSIKGVD